ncbi:putative phosphate:acyl-[acyl carrier protein] acyltransferase [Magnetofaba australis IT-1]|uniref:Phosphate acyltransferase n=1 Tax=Magnetofaba australis IT-1 TaxID=1434232 RepID=A0A1Y2K7G1_9PROT|nr:putative phosphate:acyl-[acyl carrier protein] acyltransferase [Magnetofaba australis IT-1]
MAAAMARVGLDDPRVTIRHASEVVEMDEKPSVALRTKKDSSLRVGANLVKAGEAEAFVSAGNTGALMATAKFVLKTLKGIDRPAIAARMPSKAGQCVMLDLGANVDCNSDHLCQFALMGSVYAHSVLGVEAPRVGLLNVGEEEMKGNEVVKVAGERLRSDTDKWLPYGEYIGNIEGTDIYKGGPDVVVCDGFVGNISLKSSEGVAQMLTHFLREAFGHSLLTKLGYLMARPALRRFRDRVDPRKYNGAMLLGLNGVVVKSHGSADETAFANAIEVAYHLAVNGVNDEIRSKVASAQAQQTTEDAS